MRVPDIRVIAIPGIPEIKENDDLGDLIFGSATGAGLHVQAKDIFVVAQKIVSKAEGRLIRLSDCTPSPTAADWAQVYGKDPRRVEIVLGQARRMVRMEKGLLIAQTHHGFICANAGVDSSNVPPGIVSLLPEDPDRSAERIRTGLEIRSGVPVAVIISDTFGRPWREGITNIAIGVSGLHPLLDYRGQRDSYGQMLEATVIAIADELAGAGELVMGKTSRLPVALIRGFDFQPGSGSSKDLIRPEERDLFKN
ncbi:MAG: coenzyme F420-0:L-glutamate ligase [Acidobacteria bacterium]|nr:coenzyme F420-0:L-glutamate ligase [Acidobacteriota bacterium]